MSVATPAHTRGRAIVLMTSLFEEFTKANVCVCLLVNHLNTSVQIGLIFCGELISIKHKNIPV